MYRSSGSRIVVGLACNGITREQYVGSADLRRLDAIAEFRFQEFTEMSDWDASPRASVTAHRDLIAFAETLDALILCHGAPRVDDSLLKACPRLPPRAHHIQWQNGHWRLC
jgi:hypothetical protein